MDYTVVETFTDRMDPYFVILCAKLEQEEITFRLTPPHPTKRDRNIVLGVPTQYFEQAEKIYAEIKDLSVEKLDLLKQRIELNSRTQDLLARSEGGKFRLDRILLLVVIIMIIFIAIAFLIIR